jgi:hypothetical protein
VHFLLLHFHVLEMEWKRGCRGLACFNSTSNKIDGDHFHHELEVSCNCFRLKVFNKKELIKLVFIVLCFLVGIQTILLISPPHINR